MNIFTSKHKPLTFKAIQLKNEEQKEADKIIKKLQTEPKNANKLKEKLFTDIFQKHIQQEAEKKAGKLYYYEDILQEMCLKFFEIINDTKNITTKLLLENLNKIKTDNSIKEEYRANIISINEVIKNKNGNNELTIEGSLTEDDIPQYAKQLSNKEKEIIKIKLDSIEENIQLTKKEKYILSLIKENKTNKQISKELNLSRKTINDKKLSVIAKMQDSQGQLPDKFDEYIEFLSNKYNLDDKAKTSLKKNLIKYPQIIHTDIKNIINNITNSSKLLKIEPNLFVEASLLDPLIIVRKPETLYQNINTLAIGINTPIKEMIKVSLKHPNLLKQKPETLINNLKQLAENLNTPLDKIIKTSLKFPQLFSQKPETITDNITKLAQHYNINPDIIIKIAINRPSLFVKKTDTLIKNITKLSKLTGASIEEIVNIASKQANIFYQKPETLMKNLQELAKMTNSSIEELLPIALKQANLFYQKPETLTKKLKIYKFYKLIQNKQNNKLVFRNESNEILYKKILIYLIKDSDQLHKRISEKELVKYLLQQNKTYEFNIPNHELKNELIKFIQDFSKTNLKKQIFKFK